MIAFNGGATVALLVPAIGAETLLTLLRAQWGTLRVGLYRAAHVPAIGDDTGTYQAIECNFPGYTRFGATNWSAVTTDPAGTASSRADVLTWRRTAGGAAQAVYGYFVVSPLNVLIWAEEDVNAPVAINFAGNTIRVYPSLSLWGAPPR